MAAPSNAKIKAMQKAAGYKSHKVEPRPSLDMSFWDSLWERINGGSSIMIKGDLPSKIKKDAFG